MHPPSEVTSRAHVVLLVDPHEDTRNLYACYLKLEGCEVETAEDGREALAKALVRRYDAIVSEVCLPGIEGHQLCRLLRRDPTTLRTPILLVTGDPRISEQQARSAGADGFLVKPCLPEAILAELRRMTIANSRSETPPSGNGQATTEAPSTSARCSILSRAHQRGSTITPPNSAPTLHCPMCDKLLTYEYSYVGGVSVRHAEQWDYFSCTACGRFEYRQRTRKLRSLQGG